MLAFHTLSTMSAVPTYTVLFQLTSIPPPPVHGQTGYLAQKSPITSRSALTPLTTSDPLQTIFNNGGLKTAGGSDADLATPLINFSFEKALQALGSDSAAAAANGGINGNTATSLASISASSGGSQKMSGLEDVADEVLKMQRKQRKEKERLVKEAEEEKRIKIEKNAKMKQEQEQ